MKLTHFLLSLFAVLFFAGCTPIKSPQTPTDTETGAVMQDDDKDDADANDDADNETGANDDDKDDADEGTGAKDDDKDDAKTETRTITITAKRWEYTPNEITIKKGEKVNLVVVDEDTKHGINIKGMKTTINADGSIALDTSVLGTYEFMCPNFCGEGHKEMDGNITVEE